MEILQTIWFVLLAVLLSAFVVTGGFDFGTGILLPFLGERKRNEAIVSIAPFWDANQVWLITAGGALFAAFPFAYSQILSLLYIPVMLLLAFLVLRVVGIEFYLATTSAFVKNLCAKLVFVSSLLSVLFIGVALASILEGTAINTRDGFVANQLRIFTPISICAGIMTVSFFASQGANWLAARDSYFFETARVSRIVSLLCADSFVLVFLVVCLPKPSPAVFGMLIGACIVLSISSRLLRRRKFWWAFSFNSLFAAMLICALSIYSYPYIVPAVNGDSGITIFNSASATTLKIMLFVALTGVPLAILYNIYAYIKLGRK